MATTVSASGAAPAKQVWSDYVTPGRWSSWAPQIRWVDCAGPLMLGTRAVVHTWPLGRVAFVITAIDHDRHTWSWRVGPGRGVRMDHGVCVTGATTTAWARLHLPRPVAAVYAPLARLALSRLVGLPGPSDVPAGR